MYTNKNLKMQYTENMLFSVIPSEELCAAAVFVSVLYLFSEVAPEA